MRIVDFTEVIVKMKAKVLKLASLLLALMMVVTLFAACGNDSGDSSDEIETIYVDENGNPIDINALGKDESSSEEDVSSEEEDEKDTSSLTGNRKEEDDKNDGKNEGSNGKTKFESDPYSDIPADVKGSTVKVLLWREPIATDLALKDAFEKKTGIKVEYIWTANNTADYNNKLASLIASGDSPDVANMGSSQFPSFAITSLEPLDASVFRLDDSFWNKTVMDNYKINGNYYGLAAAGTWYCDDTSYVTYYNPAKLKDMGVETMPYDLYKAGKWDTAAVESIARKVKEKNAANIGVSIQTNTISNPYMLAAGQDFVKYDGKEFSSNLSNTTVLEMQRMIAQWYDDGLVGGWNSTGLVDGTVGLFDAIAYGMYKEANWFSIDTATLDCVPVAGNSTPSNAKLWCVPKGAKNATGAAYFLRYFLDSTSFNDTSFGSMAGTFADAQMYEVWQIITDAKRPHTENMAMGCLSYYDTGAYASLTSKLSTTTAANIKTVLDEYGATMKAACNKANKYLARAQKKPSYVG